MCEHCSKTSAPAPMTRSNGYAYSDVENDLRETRRRTEIEGAVESRAGESVWPRQLTCAKDRQGVQAARLKSCPVQIKMRLQELGNGR
jgi:hypothetical protein